MHLSARAPDDHLLTHIDDVGLMPHFRTPALLEAKPGCVKEHEAADVEFVSQTAALGFVVEELVCDEALSDRDEQVRDAAEHEVALVVVALRVAEVGALVSGADLVVCVVDQHVEPAPFEGDFVDGGLQRRVQLAHLGGWRGLLRVGEGVGAAFDPGDGLGPELHHGAGEGGEEEQDGGFVEGVEFGLEGFAGEGLAGHVLDGAADAEEIVEEVGHEVHDPATDADELGNDFGAEVVFVDLTVHAGDGGENLRDILDVEDYPRHLAR